MSTYSSGSRSSNSHLKRHSIPNDLSQISASHDFGYSLHVAKNGTRASEQNNVTNTASINGNWRSPCSTKTTRVQKDLDARNREVHEPVAVEHLVKLTIGFVGIKFKCAVDKYWSCEKIITTALARYHASFPTCKIPNCNLIFHCGRKEYLSATDLISQCCHDGDEIELTVSEKSSATGKKPENATAYDFDVSFHRLPLGFIMKQENGHIVVSNIYPRSAATHYEHLVPGVTVIQIGEISLDGLGLRQLHELIKNAKFPLCIRFRGWRIPDDETAISSVDSVNTEQQIPVRRSGKEEVVPTNSACITVEGIPNFNNSSDNCVRPKGSHPSSLSSQTRQHATSAERKKSNLLASNPEHKALESRSVARSNHSVHSPAIQQVESLTNGAGSSDNQGDMPGAAQPPQAPQSLSNSAPRTTQIKGEDSVPAISEQKDVVMEKSKETHLNEGQTTPADIKTIKMSEVDSNQNDDESEEMIVEHIKLLQAELVRKHEEAKLIASQLERYHRRLTRMRSSRKVGSDQDPQQKVQHQRKENKAQPSVNVRLTPEVLEAIEAKSGLPKTTRNYASSNASSVSGYSQFSNQSAAAQRHARLARVIGRTGAGEDSMRCDASVSSYNSTSSDFRASNKSKRSASTRYNYIPPKYSATTQYYDAPSSFSTKGAVMSRAKATRDSFIRIPDGPGVGAYDVKTQERVRGGEIGDSDRSLPWSRG